MNRTFGYSMAVVREALALYQTPMSCKAVSREMRQRHGSAPTRVSIANWARRAGITRPIADSRALGVHTLYGKDYVALRREAARLIYEESYTRNAAAIKLGLSPKTLTSMIPPDEAPSRGEAISSAWWQRNDERTTRRRAIRDLVLSMRESGASYAEIAAETHLHTDTILTYLRAAGMTKRLQRRRAAA